MRPSEPPPPSRGAQAARRLQGKFRQHQDNKRFRERLAERKLHLQFFSWPIFFASAGSLSGAFIYLHYRENDPEAYASIPSAVRLLWWVFLLLPSLLIVFIDRFYNRIQFSLAHTVFFIGPL